MNAFNSYHSQTVLVGKMLGGIAYGVRKSDMTYLNS